MNDTKPKKIIKLKDKYELLYQGTELFVYGDPKLVWTIQMVDGVRAGNMGGVAVGVNDKYILFRQESNRKFDKDVWFVTLDKVTGEEKKHSERPSPKIYGRFSRIKHDFIDESA